MGFEYILGCWDGRIDAIPRLEYVHRLSIFSFLVDAISGEPLPERNPISPHTIYDVSTRRFLPDAQYGINYTLHCRLIVITQKLLRVFNLENGPRQ